MRGNLPPLLLMSLELSGLPDGGQQLIFVPHPAAEDARLVSDGKGSLHFSAKTSTVGPNYHAFLCELLRKMGNELNIEWCASGGDRDAADPTGCFFSGSPDLIVPVMLAWLDELANQVLRLMDQHNPLTGLQLGSGAVPMPRRRPTASATWNGS